MNTKQKGQRVGKEQENTEKQKQLGKIEGGVCVQDNHTFVEDVFRVISNCGGDPSKHLAPYFEAYASGRLSARDIAGSSTPIHMIMKPKPLIKVIGLRW